MEPSAASIRSTIERGSHDAINRPTQIENKPGKWEVTIYGAVHEHYVGSYSEAVRIRELAINRGIACTGVREVN